MYTDLASKVALVRCRDYEIDCLNRSLDELLAACPPPANPQGLQVLLKPNLISARHDVLACTEGAVLIAVSRWFLDRGARVTMGDSPAFGTAAAVLAKLGVRDELLQLGVKISDFSRTRKVRLASGGSAVMAADALECDLLVNLPRVKAHAQTRMTLAVKNCFGCLVGLHKPWWHMVHGGVNGRFTDLLLELLEHLADSLTVVDGVRAMHVSGPIHGRPYSLGLLAAGHDPVAVDTALLALLNLDPVTSPLQVAARKKRLPGAFLHNLSFPLLTPVELQVNDFLVPDSLNPIRFNPFSFLAGTLRRLMITQPIKK